MCRRLGFFPLFVVALTIVVASSCYQFVYTNSVIVSLISGYRGASDNARQTLNQSHPADGSHYTALESTTSASTWKAASRGKDNQQRESSANGLKTILLWSSKYGNEEFGIGLGREGFIRNGCAENRCSVTKDKNLSGEVDAILFHAPSTYRSTMPVRTRLSQIWIFYCLESPLTVSRNVRDTRDRYNLTMTYLIHPDTDIVTVIRRLKKPVSDRTAAECFRRKTRTAVWPVSKCVGTPSSRNRYAKELGRYVDIDVYGRCGNYSCPIDDKAACYAKFECQYFFYLSFENSVCDQYVTEKVYSALRRHIVPVILGGADYKRLLPPRSYLDVRDFRSARHLASYMTYLRRNVTAYMEHLAWKENASYYVRRQRAAAPSYGKAGAFCRLCEVLHDRKYRFKVNFDIERYFSARRLCLSGDRELAAVHLKKQTSLHDQLL